MNMNLPAGLEQPPKNEIRVDLGPVYALKDPMEHLLDQMRDRIDRHEYKLIIGDDASGRIPTFIMTKFLKKVYGREDAKKLQTLFFAGFGPGGEEEQQFYEGSIKKKKAAMKESLGKYTKTSQVDRVLLVTDTIVTGSSIIHMIDVLRELDFHVDVATVAIFDWDEKNTIEQKRKELEAKFKCKIFVGSRSNDEPPEIVGQLALSGVSKNEKELHSKIWLPRVLDELDEKEHWKNSRDFLNAARRAANEVAKGLAEWYKKR